jgi:hypothetical protein
MIEVLADEKKLIDAEFGSNILANLINSIPKDEKKEDSNDEIESPSKVVKDHKKKRFF